MSYIRYIAQDNGEGMERMIKGLTTQVAQQVDTHATEELCNFLFKEEDQEFGEDLLARNIQVIFILHICTRQSPMSCDKPHKCM